MKTIRFLFLLCAVFVAFTFSASAQRPVHRVNISGYIFDQFGSPFQGETVLIWEASDCDAPMNGNAGFSVVSDANGRFFISNYPSLTGQTYYNANGEIIQPGRTYCIQTFSYSVPRTQQVTTPFGGTVNAANITVYP